MKKRDIIIYIIILAALVLSVLLNYFFSKNGDFVRIYVDKEIYADYPLYEDKTIEIDGKNNIKMFLIIKDKSAYVTDSSCSDKVCETTGYISKTNESIICLPGKIVISVISDNDAEYDTISR